MQKEGRVVGQPRRRYEDREIGQIFRLPLGDAEDGKGRPTRVAPSLGSSFSNAWPDAPRFHNGRHPCLKFKGICWHRFGLGVWP